jgi:hypothetical protein
VFSWWTHIIPNCGVLSPTKSESTSLLVCHSY